MKSNDQERERERILRNVRQMYFDIVKYQIGGRRMLALEGLGMILATFFKIPKHHDPNYWERNKVVLDLYDKIRGARGESR